MGDHFISSDMGKEKAIVGNMADPILLNKIDKLFASGVGQYISLPQLVVVGDQSSGKSSVLEGLTNLPFPRDSGLCTRFATQITFRRSEATKISVSIIPDKRATEEHIEEVKKWEKTDLNELDAKSFAKIMAEVHMVMGLGGDEDKKGDRGTFSEDVLKLEICGPDQEHFSVIDVPGIFRKTTEGITTKADKDMVKSMVRRYMDNPRSIMLTVVPANVDIATQEILTMAEEADEDGHRTLGVLTKPDLVDSGAEGPVTDLLEGKRHKLALGWCVVRNLGQKQLQSLSADRDALEMEFFRDTAPWNTLDKDKVGVGALRIRLQEVLASNIRREFTKVRAEIHKRLTATKQTLEKLGTKRETPAEQSRFLLDMSMRFQEIVTSSLSANYVGSDWFDQYPSLRFATAVVNRNEQFATMLERHGHFYTFDDASLTDSERYGEDDNNESEAAGKYEVKDGEINVRLSKDADGLEESVCGEETIRSEARQNVVDWLTTVYKTSRGFELGTFDSSLLAMTMKTQSVNWESVALGYVKDVISMAHGFISDLLKLICPDERVREGLMSVLMDELSSKYQGAVEHVRFLLFVERTGTPATLNHYFNDNLEKSRQQRLRDNLKDKVIPDAQLGSVIRLEDLVHNHHMSNVEHVVQEIHDILKSYYKVAQKRFADNVCMQAADYHLVTGPGSPLKLFSPSFVSGLSEEQLVEIAGEDAVLKRKRTALNKEIADLEAAKKILS